MFFGKGLGGYCSGLILVILALVAVLAAAPALPAQDARGTIVGRVADVSGGVIPGAGIRATNTATGVTITARSNESGNFVLPYLQTGTYTLTIEATGFKKYVNDAVQVRINDTVDVNVQLQVGSVAETVEVTAETPLLATAEASLGQVVDERRVTELPLFAGNAMDLVHLAPGTVNGTDMRLRKAPFNNAPSQFATDGGTLYGNEFTIDGVSNTYSDGTQPRVAFSPPQTAIAEFKIQTSMFDASIGHTIGSVVNVSTKGGTNTFHGEAHEWLRHSALDAPTLFQNRAAKPGQRVLPVYQDNRYGLSGGSPVILPKIYNGKNKTFWFFAWEANKFGDPNVGGSQISTVPTEAMRRGDLSGLLALGSTYQVYDPLTTKLVGARYQRDPFAGNIIPTARLDKVGQNILKLWPLPNQPGSRDFQQNFFLAGKAIENYWTTIGRIDHVFSEKHRVFLRLNRDYWQEDKNRVFGNDVNGIILNRINRAVAFDDVYVFTPTFLVNFRYGATAQEFPEHRVSRGFDLSSLGFSADFLKLTTPGLATIPRIGVGNLTELSSVESGDGTTSSITHSLGATFSRPRGNHNFRFGPEFRVYREFRNRYPTDIVPYFSFAATYTRLNDTSSDPAGGGGPLTALLTGIPGGNMTRSASYAEQDKYFALWVQDDYKVTRKLTLNLGLRYEYESPITERYNRAVVHFAADVASPIEATVKTAYALNPIPEIPASQFKVKGGLTFANVSPNPRTYWGGQNFKLAPRLGLAWQAHRKTVIRAGYGIFYASIGVNYTNTIQDGFTRSTPIQASPDNGQTYAAFTANPFPTGLYPPLGAQGGLSTNLNQTINFFPMERKQPYAQRWSFGIQHELPARYLLEASYVGNRTTRTGITRNVNYVPAQYYSTLPSRDQKTIDYLGTTFPDPFRGTDPIYTGTTRNRNNLLQPYPQFSSVNLNFDPAGFSWYHSLQVRGEKRWSRGYTMQWGYTWSKNMEATTFLNAQDPMPYRSLASLDRTHRVVWSGQWELPFGRKRAVGANWHPALNFILGGWQLNGMMQKQSGQPIDFGNVIYLSGNVALPADQRTVDRWFNLDAFNRNSAQQLASNIRTAPWRFSGVRMDPQSRWDASAIKNFKVTERMTTQFRAECFNVTNHPVLRGPTTGPTSGTFGAITAQEPPRSWQLALKLTF